jgi:cytochrome c oxidase assembly factor CtaG/cytochrome c2
MGASDMRLGRFIADCLSAVLVLPQTAWAHSGGTGSYDTVGAILGAWTWDPWTLVPLLVAAWWYGMGVHRSIAERRSVAANAVACFVAGMFFLVLALQSPIDTISGDLFSVHMVQHLLLILAAPPFLVYADPAIVFIRALPPKGRKRLARLWTGAGFGVLLHWATQPLVVWFLFCGIFVFWHAPGPYQWALDNNAVHISEHLSFFLISMAFWSIVLSPHRRRRLDYGSTLLFIVSTAILSGLPGALMIFASRPLYPGHSFGAAKWGLTLLDDQQLAGLIMWIPAGAAYVIAASLVFLKWLQDSETRAVAAARRTAPLVLALLFTGGLLGGCDREIATATTAAPGDVSRGKALVQQYGCGNCHLIPRMTGAQGNVGPPLLHIGTRIYIAGFVRNSPENMSIWLQDPQKVLPGNAMPAMGISVKDSRDITAFLYSLK